MSEDIPSVKELANPKSKVPSIYPEGVRFSKKWRLFKTAWAGIILVVIAFFVIGFAAAALRSPHSGSSPFV